MCPVFRDCDQYKRTRAKRTSYPQNLSTQVQKTSMYCEPPCPDLRDGHVRIGDTLDEKGGSALAPDRGASSIPHAAWLNLLKSISAVHGHGDTDTFTIMFPEIDFPIPDISYADDFQVLFDRACGLSGRLQYNGAVIHQGQSPKSLRMKSHDKIVLKPSATAKNPIIYLFAPHGRTVFASISVALVPQWEFCVIYPIVPILGNAKSGEMGGKGQHITWNVRTHTDGTLSELNTGLDVSYLFWEARYIPCYISPIFIRA